VVRQAEGGQPVEVEVEAPVGEPEQPGAGPQDEAVAEAAPGPGEQVQDLEPPPAAEAHGDPCPWTALVLGHSFSVLASARGDSPSSYPLYMS